MQKRKLVKYHNSYNWMCLQELVCMLAKNTTKETTGGTAADTTVHVLMEELVTINVLPCK